MRGGEPAARPRRCCFEAAASPRRRASLTWRRSLPSTARASAVTVRLKGQGAPTRAGQSALSLPRSVLHRRPRRRAGHGRGGRRRERAASRWRRATTTPTATSSENTPRRAPRITTSEDEHGEILLARARRARARTLACRVAESSRPARVPASRAACASQAPPSSGQSHRRSFGTRRGSGGARDHAMPPPRRPRGHPPGQPPPAGPSPASPGSPVSHGRPSPAQPAAPRPPARSVVRPRTRPPTQAR